MTRATGSDIERRPGDAIQAKKSDRPASSSHPPARGWLTRRRTSALSLMVATLLVFYLCWRIAQPFVPALAWAVALAILGTGLHRWLLRRLHHPAASAGLATAVLIFFIAAPVVALSPVVAGKAREGWDSMQSTSVKERVHKVLKRSEALAPIADVVAQHVPSTDELAKQITPRLSRLAVGSVWAGVELLVAFFALRIYFDLPGDAVPGRAEAVRWYGWLVGNFLLIVDIVVAVPTLWLFARYARLSPMSETDVRRRMMAKQEA